MPKLEFLRESFALAVAPWLVSDEDYRTLARQFRQYKLSVIRQRIEQVENEISNAGSVKLTPQEREALLEGIEWVRVRGAASSVEPAISARAKLEASEDDTIGA